jgi:hypothetical protein
MFFILRYPGTGETPGMPEKTIVRKTNQHQQQ